MKEAHTASTSLDNLLGEQTLTIPIVPFSPPKEPAKIASELLKGFIAIKENNTAEGIAHFLKASKTDIAMVYNEPRDWLLNAKQYEGTAYLLTKQWANAEKAFRTDLKRNAQNVWSLSGLLQSLKGQKKTLEANLLEERLKTAVKKNDLQMGSLSFN